ncbi:MULTISPECIES: D-2-hydroxyacid dehydrogenase family protein [unclassified Paenibacillus]|uniref:D-2-hydroxyacid dehydrogenase family protein n=1 Tax=unclassified Paenibacillus TaxID=185978 RepID=UPI0010533E6C|nr:MULTISPECIES: D-2-hydroxyacid dehydrogenase family protein [unclassified Paenibacillus]NIK71654.1 phosphoglycerate dehydrogenase-like enzyme [Paenibacillus sp. BK720]TCM96303.1 phosphoglycerate dehydrogenase-like enzyme [Paenibacillus sp. BK033]
MKCAVLDDYQNAALRMADWSQVTDRIEVQVFNHHFENQDELIASVQDCEIVVVMRERTPFRKELLQRLPNLKLLVTTGMRNASIDLATAAEQGITVCGTKGGGEGTTELTWALILGLARKLVPENEAVRNGGWQSTIGVDLHGKRLGLLGLGHIGTNVARIGQAFGMKVTAWSRNLTAEKAAAAGVTLAGSKEELLESSDFVSIHLVLSDRTRGLIGEKELERMRPTAFLINTSRGPIVERKPLLEALRSGKIAGAGIDVFEQEPLPQDDPFRLLPNVLATPHIGYVTEAAYRGFYKGIVEDIEAYLAGSPVNVLT